MKALKVKDLCKTYIINKRQNHVLRNVNFDIEEGEFVAVMGPSGSGKSTLLYTVSGMDEATAGNILFYGKDITGFKPDEMSDLRLNEMGFVFQQMHMLRNLTIYDNIIVSAYQSRSGRKKGSREAINKRAMELMRRLDIIDIADNDITEVSGGQLQRACICRSLINHPKIIFADEPTGALNSRTGKEVMDEFCKINKTGTTIMVVTHDIKVAAKSDRVIYIMDGNIQDQCVFGKYEGEDTRKERERRLNNWLLDMGW